MAQRLDSGYFGEQGSGFVLGSQGYFLVEGPSGDGGHAANAAGFDGVAFNPTTNDLICYDNKCFAAVGNVGSATAIDPAKNLANNLDALIARLTASRDIPRRFQMIDLLRRTRLSLTTAGVSPPPNVRIAVTNYGGNSRGITQALRNRGLTFIDMNAAPRVPAPAARVYVSRVTVPQAAHDLSASVGAYNTRRAAMDGAAVVTASLAQAANDMAVKHAIERKLTELYDDIAEAMVTKGGALVVIVVTASAPDRLSVTARSVTSAYVYNLPAGLTRQQATDTYRAAPQMFSCEGSGADKEILLYWYGPK
jgi:hypothetical protein